MFSSIGRKSAASILAIVVPPALVLGFQAPLWTALLAALPGIALALHLARSVARQVRHATVFVQQLLEPGVVQPHLAHTDDELGELAFALHAIAPKIEDLVHRLRTELTRREAILASMTEGVIAIDARLNVTFCNQAFVRAVGDPEVVDGGPLIRVVREPVLFRILKEVIESGTTIRRRDRLGLPNSPSFEIYAAPLAGATSRGALAILHDLTASEKVERMRRDFVANVSHEFRTPLATIRGYAETLLDGGLEDQANRRKFVEIILANGIRLNNIAADLLVLSELDEGKPPADAGPISVGDVVHSAIRAVEPAAHVTGIRILAADFPEAYVWGQRIRLEQALVNLIDNAVKFNKPNGEVRIRVSLIHNGQIEIAISDTGIGIPSQDLSRIFERFYRVDRARSRQVGGTGLGLSIVNHALQQINATVQVESELGRGSTFRVLLPVCPPPTRIS